MSSTRLASPDSAVEAGRGFGVYDPVPLAKVLIKETVVTILTGSQRFKHLLADPVKTAAAFRQSGDPYGLGLKGERPEKILVINCGSSSLKYAFFDTASEAEPARGLIERIGGQGMRLVQQGPRGEVARELPRGGYEEAFQAMLVELTAKETGVLREPSEITVVGHRVVHGGERFSEGVVIDDEVLREIETLNPLAPLHNPVNLAGIQAARRIFPAVPHVAVFDSGFHHTLASYAYLYGLPYEYYEKMGVRRYGFHGSSHAYVCLRAAQHLQRRGNELEIARETLRALNRSYLTRVIEAHRNDPIPIEVSAHHIHLAQEHVEALFGQGHRLTRQSDLSQPGQFACREQLAIVGPKGRVERVRVLGPMRKATQVEISMTEQFKLDRIQSED